MSEYQEITTWKRFDVGCCGFEMAVPQAQWQHWYDSGETFWCPRCKSPRVYSGKKAREQATIERLERETKRLEQERNSARSRTERERRSHTATKGHLTRQRKRAANGVCPCCGRTFKQLPRHMKSQHPDFVEQHAQ